VKKILITGGAGFIGRYFVNLLQDADLRILDLKKPDFDTRATFIQGDVRNIKDVQKAMAGVDTVIHLAAMHHDFGIADDAYFDTNVNGAKIIADEAHLQGVCRIINFSSVAVYGNAGNPGPTTEETSPNPQNAYGKSKWEAEQIFEKWATRQTGRKLVTVRSTVVFGPFNLANVLSLIRIIHQGLYIQIGPGNNIKSLAYVENIVEAALFALENACDSICLMNYADEPHLTSSQIAQMQAKMLAKNIRFSLPLPLGILLARPFDLAIFLSGKNLSISSKRVKKLQTQTWHSAVKIKQMGFVPRVSIQEGMQKMIQWYLKSQPEKNSK
jgi:nucleoside-diphosphate-sugar epimerase